MSENELINRTLFGHDETKFHLNRTLFSQDDFRFRAEIHLRQQEELIKQQQELIKQQQEQLNTYKKESMNTNNHHNHHTHHTHHNNHNNHLPHKKHKKTVRFQLIPFHTKLSKKKTRKATPLPRRSGSLSQKFLKL